MPVMLSFSLSINVVLSYSSVKELQYPEGMAFIKQYGLISLGCFYLMRETFIGCCYLKWWWKKKERSNSREQEKRAS